MSIVLPNYMMFQSVAAAGCFLDDYTSGLHEVWSFRCALSSYTGPCARIRRDSDNLAYDFDFDTNGELSGSSIRTGSSSTLSTFLSGATGYVNIVYGQANGRNLVQNTHKSQPRLDLTSTPTGKASMYFDGINSQITSNNSFSYGTNDDVSIMQTIARDGIPPSVYHVPFITASNSAGTSLASPGYFLAYLLNSANHRLDQSGSTGDLWMGGGSPTNQDLVLNSWIYNNGVDAKAYQNGTLADTASGTSFTLANNVYWSIGKYSTRKLRGWVSDFIVWGSPLNDTNRGAIETDIINYHSI